MVIIVVTEVYVGRCMSAFPIYEGVISLFFRGESAELTGLFLNLEVDRPPLLLLLVFRGGKLVNVLGWCVFCSGGNMS